MSALDSLCLHAGAREVSREELAVIEAPPPTSTWFPIKHDVVVETVQEALRQGGFSVERAKYALSGNNNRLFSTMDLSSPLASGVNLCVGVRNSIDKSLPLGFCAGSHVFVCDNLAFHSELLVCRKHTRFGQDRFQEAIVRAVQSLSQFQDAERVRIRRFQDTILREEWASHLLLKAYEQKLISHLVLPKILQEWREPQFEEFQPRTLWSFLNSFTTVLRDRQKSNPQQFAATTIALQDLLAKEAIGQLASEPVFCTPA
jgi:hypothetical protein